MNRTHYKNNFNKEHYERLNVSVPKGAKQVIKELAESKGLSVNAYFLELIKKEQKEIFDSMQLSEQSREKILFIKGNTAEGYTVTLKNGSTFQCKTKLQIRQYLAQDKRCIAQDI